MRKNRRIIALLIFTMLLTVTGYRVYHILGFQDNVHSKAVFEQFYDLPEDTLDVVWVGPSSVQEEVISSVMYDTNGITLYPFGLGNMPFNATEHIIREIEKTQNPEVYLVDIRDLAYCTLSETTIRRTVDNMKWSSNRVDTIKAMTADLERFYPYEEINMFDYYFSFTKYHSRWSELCEADFTDDRDSYLGYWIKYGSTSFNEEEVVPLFSADDRNIPEENEYFLERFLDFCDSFNKPVIFTCTPSCLNAEKFGQYNYAKKIIEDRGYEVWDLNDHVNEMGIDYHTDFSDAMHLNVWGAQKLSAYVAVELQNRFGFQDHREDEAYSVYQEYADKYISRMDEISIITETNLDDYLTKLTKLGDGYMIIVSVRDTQGYSLTEEEIDLLKQLGFAESDTLLERQYHSFVGIIDNGTLVYEDIGVENNGVQYSSWLEGRQVSVESHIYFGMDYSSIKLGNTEYSKNLRGLNFVIVNNDTGEVIDSVVFDTHVPEFTCTR